MKRIIRAAVLSAAAAGITAGSLGLAGAASATSTTTSGLTASQAVTGRSDSGANGGTWAIDKFTATIHIAGQGIVASSNCPGITAGGKCYLVTGNVKDAGTFTTQPGNAVPGGGSLNGNPPPNIGASVTGPMSGTLPYRFFTDQPLSAASAGNVPATIAGDTPSTGQLPEQFYPAGTHFWDTSGTTGGSEYLGSGPFNFVYTAALGSDSQCPNVSGRWVDASTDNSGADPFGGNILAPDASHC